MKKIIFLTFILICITSCGNKTGNQQNAENLTANSQSYKLDDLLKIADQKTDEQVTVRGYVTHACKHSGKRCFIVGEDSETSFRIEAKGNINGFSQELVGSEIAVTGTIKENRLSKEYISQHEKEVNEKKEKEEGALAACEAELNNINSMKEWMKANNKDYYSTYYMEGESYEIVEK